MSAVVHQVQDLQARFPAPPPQPPAPAPVVQPVMTLAPPAQVLAPAVPPPAPAPDAVHAGQAALGTAPAQVSGMDGTTSLVLNRVQQPNPLSQNVTSAPAIAKSYRQPPAFNGTTSAQVMEPDAWFDTVIQYLRDTNANPMEGLRYYCTGDVLTWYNSFTRKCKDTNQQLTLEALRADFIELFGDINRDTPHQVRERLDKHEHAMKPSESVPVYVQRFRRITRNDPQMAQIELIHWFLKGLQPQLQSMCATDASGLKWSTLENLIEFAKGQQWSLNAAKSQKASFNFTVGQYPSAPPKQGGRGRGARGGSTGRGRGGGRDHGRGHGRLSEQARAALKAANICTHCYEPWGKGHRCFKWQRREDGTGGQQVA
ncbi:hypothetical protein Vretimale_15197 [Volvox reticuliferus]|uniref:Retrotransposon gag domain-containing protein n=1 Tax=Volvox reticuliferus TaxID=1737510 RepID=A0A8J4GNM2_9CHLO|nr:hypothetical protein Vretifemale_5393 [Volvox reticuliferus]GIM11732.1 hypothetical protein Vretimale_15197 [Volvox reticuliferus]